MASGFQRGAFQDQDDAFQTEDANPWFRGGADAVATSEALARAGTFLRDPTDAPTVSESADVTKILRPTFRSLGSFASSTVTNFTAGLPTGWQVNDIFIAVFRHNTAGAGMSAGWTQIGTEQNYGNRMSVWWRRAVAGDTDPTFLSTSNACAQIAAYSNCVRVGDPFESVQGGADSSADTTFGPTTGITTSGSLRVYLVGIGRAGDSAAGFYSNPTVPGGTDVVEQIDRGFTAGTGGGIALFEAQTAGAGSYGPWRMDSTSTTDGYVEFALIGFTPYNNFGAEAVSTSESATRSGTFSRTIADAPTIADTATRSVGLSRTTSDTPTLSDTATAEVSGGAAVNRTTTDAVTTSESAARTVAAVRTTTDAPSLSEAATAAKSTVRTTTDAPAVSESASALAVKSRATTEAPTTSDTATRSGTFSRTSTDAPSVSDSATAAINGDVVRTTVDSLTLSESATASKTIARTATEAVSTSESATWVRSYFRTVLDPPATEYCFDFTGGAPAGWTNTDFFEGGGSLFTRSGGLLDALTHDGDPADDAGFTTMQLDFFTPDPVDADYWFVEQDSVGMYVYVDNQYDFLLPPGAGNYGLYAGGAAFLIDDSAIGSLVSSNWYTIKAETNPVTRRTRAKIWEKFGDPEPDWQIDSINPDPIGFWPLAIYVEVDNASPDAITIDNACWTVQAGSGVTDSVARTLAASRQLTDDTEMDEWPVTNATVQTPVYGQVPNGYQPELAAPINNTQTTITVTQPLPPGTELPILVYINGEYVLVTAVSPDGLTWTVVRGQNTSTATSHTTAHILPANTTVSVGGVQVGADVNYSRTRLATYANGQVGTGEIWIRGLPTGITTGEEVVVRHRNVRVWGGYIANIKRAYIFPAGTGNPGDEPSWVVLEVVDYNILFRKRIYYDKDTPTHMKVQTWPNGTRDDLVIGAVVNRRLNLGGDGLSFDIHHVGTPGLPVDSCNPDAPDRFQIAWAGYAWGDAMRAIADQTGAVYYIDPDKTFRYVDDSIKQSAFGFTGLSDDPGGTVIGYRDFELSNDATKLVNEQFTWGVGQGATAPVLGHAMAPTSIANHGLWQQAEIRFDMYCQGTVNLRANTWLDGSPQNRRGHKEDHIAIRATTFTPYLRVADVVSCESTTFDFIDNIPVRGAEITFPTPWDIQNVLTISHEYDSPWEAYEFAFPDFPDFRFRPPGPIEIGGFPTDCVCCPTVCYQQDFDYLFPGPGWGSDWSLSTSGGGTGTHVTFGEAYIMDLVTETAPGPVSKTSSVDVGECFGGDTFNAELGWVASGEINNNLDLLDQSFGAGFYTGPTFLTPLTAGERVQFMTFGSWSSGSFPPSIAICTDGAGTGYMFLGRPGTIYYYEPYTFPFTADVIYKVRVYQNDSSVKVKLWVDGEAEPVSWALEDNTLAANYDLTGHFAISAGRRLDGGVSATGLTIAITELELSETGAGACPEYVYQNQNAHPNTMIASGETFGYVSDLDAFSNANPILDHGGYSDSELIDLSSGCILDSLTLDVSGGDDAVYGSLLQGKYSQIIYLWGRDINGQQRPLIYWYRSGPATWRMYVTTPGSNGWTYREDVSGTTLDVNFTYDDLLETATVFAGTVSQALPWEEGRIEQFLLTDNVAWSGTLDIDPITVQGTLVTTGGGDPGPGPCAEVDPDDLFAPVSDGTLYGVSPLGGVDLENGNFLYTFDQQFLPGSTEVWADGLRLRVVEDYDEHPENAAIEIHSDAQSGFTTFDPGMVIVANMMPFVTHDPPPEYVP